MFEKKWHRYKVEILSNLSANQRASFKGMLIYFEFLPLGKCMVSEQGMAPGDFKRSWVHKIQHPWVACPHYIGLSYKKD